MPPEIPRNANRFVPAPRALLIDAGMTLVSYDGQRIAALAGQRGVKVGAAAIEATEAAVRAELAQHDWPQRPGSGASSAGGARFMRRLLELAGARADGPMLDEAADHIWASHLTENLWSRVLEGVRPALVSLRAAGLRLAVVSNSEGTLLALLESIDLARHFHAIVDSWVVGVTKPDPRIFLSTLEQLGVPAGDALMVGDSLRADVGGAEAAGLRAALIDPLDLYREAAVPRFATFAAVAEAVLDGRE